MGQSRGDDTLKMEIPHGREEAIALQLRLRERCILRRLKETGEMGLVAGADAAYHGDLVFGAAVMVELRSLETVAAAISVEPVRFPYLPGLLAFREGPAILSALGRLSRKPDAIILNGHGIAHPRRFGLACHIGLLLGIPSIGVARRLLCGSCAAPSREEGACSPVMDGGEVIAMAVRTRAGARPVYVSPGHMVDMAQAVELVLSTSGGQQLPVPLQRADGLAADARRKHLSGRRNKDDSRRADAEFMA